MDVVVCVKRVPDTEAKVRVAADGRSIDAAGIQWIMAPYDEIAVEKALQLRDAAGGGTVTVVSVGPAETSKELRTALAMGADKAVLVTAPTGAGDAFIAGFLHAWLDGGSLEQALILGTERGAIACMHRGGFPQAPLKGILEPWVPTEITET